MAKPNYLQLAEQIKNETDPVKKNQLLNELYVFTDTLTDEEKDLFNYVSKDYLENNPGKETFINNIIYPFVDVPKAQSYIGVYYPE